MTDTAHDLRLSVLVPLGEVRALARNSRGHWSARAKATESVRSNAHWRAKEVMAGRPGFPIRERVEVDIGMRVADRRRRDPDNTSGPGKPILDGLVDAGLLADDSAEQVASVRYTYAGACADVPKGVVEFIVRLTPVD